MKRIELIRRLARLRTRGRPDEATLACLTKAQLHARPECLVVSIVEGWLEMKKLGHPEADILREIEGRRERAFGAEPIPADLTLDSYACYRLRLECPQDEGAHDPVFAMQATHLAKQVLEGSWFHSDPGLKARPVRMLAALCYLFLLVLWQAAWSVTMVMRHGFGANAVAAGVLVFTGVLALACIGWYGLTVWGRPLLAFALSMEALAPWFLIGALTRPQGGLSGAAMLQAVNAMIVLAILAYLRFGRDAGRVAA